MLAPNADSIWAGPAGRDNRLLRVSYEFREISYVYLTPSALFESSPDLQLATARFRFDGPVLKQNRARAVPVQSKRPWSSFTSFHFTGEMMKRKATKEHFLGRHPNPSLCFALLCSLILVTRQKLTSLDPTEAARADQSRPLASEEANLRAVSPPPPPSPSLLPPPPPTCFLPLLSTPMDCRASRHLIPPWTMTTHALVLNQGNCSPLIAPFPSLHPMHSGTGHRVHDASSQESPRDGVAVAVSRGTEKTTHASGRRSSCRGLKISTYSAPHERLGSNGSDPSSRVSTGRVDQTRRSQKRKGIRSIKSRHHILVYHPLWYSQFRRGILHMKQCMLIIG